MSLNLSDSRGFPSILLVNFSILHTEGKTKLSKNGKKNMRLFVILSRSTKKTRSSVSGFSTQVIRAKIYVCQCASD